MRGESNLQRSRLKGYMFETILMKLLKNNNFLAVEERSDKIRENRRNFIEVRGRGTWHQIDCLCDYSVLLPFMFPIRMLGEVKFHSNSISKEKVREFIGVVKDIQENYFASDDISEVSNRVSEIGVFFSTSGFQKEAVKLAFAHNIKTVSYKNNHVIERIKNLITDIERNYLRASYCISEGNMVDFINDFSEILESNNNNYNEFINKYNGANGLNHRLNDLEDFFISIRSNFVASTSAGVFLHFIGYDEFPVEIFRENDFAKCEVYFNDTDEYWIEFSADENIPKRRFFFTPPISLRKAAFYGGKTILNEKERIFRSISVSIKINGIRRNLTIDLNNSWLEALKANI